jgi:hypothetical protein
VFSHPTSISNPLFPVRWLRQAVQLGHDAEGSLRQEVTLLPETRTIRWRGSPVQTLVQQLVASSDGRILEVAVDYFAQDDRGAVWYFGEAVDNYEDGVIADHDGSWLAGRDGPPGMIMPAHPQVGDHYRPENIPGLVFEEVEVLRVNQTVPGPRGPVRGAIAVREHPMDGALEDKVFAPGYGEFLASVPDEEELVDMGVAHPTDLLGLPVPQPLWTLSSSARKAFDDAPTRHWAELQAIADRVDAAWNDVRRGPVPPHLRTLTTAAVGDLGDAVAARSVRQVRQAAIDLAHATYDLQMQHRDPASIDRDRIEVWKRQLLVDAQAGDRAGVDSDRTIIEAIADRNERH